LFKGLFGVKLKANYKISSQCNSGEATATLPATVAAEGAGDDGSGGHQLWCGVVLLYRRVSFGLWV